jgi:hypothetical protein
LFYRFKKLRKMKKLVFMFVAVAAISFASCGNKTAQSDAAVDSDSIAVVDSAEVVDTTAAADTTAVDSTAAQK